MLYKKRVFNTYSLNIPVISIGNITMGGTGKTPMVETVIRTILSFNSSLKLAVLSRGYKGNYEGKCQIVSDGKKIFLSPDESGDEPYLIAENNKNVCVIVGKKRYNAGMLAEKELSPDFFILDDGFQHLALKRNLNLLLISAKNPFGGDVCPSGTLREPCSAIQRADAIIITRSESAKLSEKEYSIIKKYSKAPIFTCDYEITAVEPLLKEESKKISSLQNKKIGAFAGLANPNSFFLMLEKYDIKPISTVSLSDHSDYDKKNLIKIADNLANCEIWITTEKDAVKLRYICKQRKNKTVFSKPVYVIKVAHKFSKPDRFRNFIVEKVNELCDPDQSQNH